jgi:ribosome-binding factor A
VVRRTSQPYARSERVAALVHEVVAEQLERLVDQDERLEFVTVTDVRLSGDLRSATVLIASGTDDTLAALDEWRGDLQRAVGRQVRMKRIPALRFELDARLAESEEIERILRSLSSSDAGDERHPPR